MTTIKKDSTGNVATLLILDADGLPQTGVAYNATGLEVYYTVEGSAPVQITLSAGVWTERVHGLYEVDVPDAAYTAAGRVSVTGDIGSGVVIGDQQEVVLYIIESTTTLDAVAEAVVNEASLKALIDAWEETGRLDELLDAIKAKVDANETTPQYGAT